VIVPYNNEYQWTLAIETALNLKAHDYPVEIKVLHPPNLDFFKSAFKRIFGFRSIDPRIISKLRVQDVYVKNYYIFPTLKCFRLNKNYSSKYERELEISLANIVNDLRTEKFDFVNKLHKVRIRKHLRDVIHTNLILSKIDFSKFKTVYTVNGRFSCNRAIVKYVRNKGVTVKVIDLTSYGKYVVVDNGQSMLESIRRIDNFWHEYDVTSRIHDAEKYFSSKLDAIRDKSDPWSAYMNEPPNLNLPNKRIGIFYTTTQLEFVGNDDPIIGNNFKNQNEAIAAVYNWLRFHGWLLIIRRHPRNIFTEHFMEDDDLFEGLLQLDEAIVIPGGDRTDSYELAEKADLIISYGSSIAAEFIYANRKPVISVGMTPWYLYDKENHLLSMADLNSVDPKNIGKSEPCVVLPWALYNLHAGSDFKFVTKNSRNKQEFGNIEIFNSFLPWLKLKFENLRKINIG